MPVMSMKSNEGFSLVELMVVVAIIGILAAIAIPNFQRFTAKARQAEAKAVLSAIYSAERAFHSEWQTFASSFNVVGYRPTGWQRYNHGFAAQFPAGAIANGYTGPANDAIFSAQVLCGAGAIGAAGCGVVSLPIAPENPPPGAAMAVATFTAGASAHIGNANAALFDRWTIDQTKVLNNTQSGLP